MKKLNDFKIVLMFSLLFLIGSGYIPAYSSAPCTSQGTLTLPVGPTLWNVSITVVNDVVVPAGATLTIDGAVINFTDVMIRVAVGGRINIYNGAVLQRSPNCPCVWGGILVEGDRNQCQTPTNLGLQGYLDMRNSTISGAYTAIEGRDGAILICRESNFINNKIDVMMTPYSYNNNCNNGCDNGALFSLCNFIWDKPICGNPDFDTHVWLIGVYDIEFSGCQFRNDYPVVYGLANTRGIGIKADDASFDVKHWGIAVAGQGHFTGCNNTAWGDCHDRGTRSLFCELQIGIKANWSAAGHINTCDPTRVHYAIFNDNNYSILTTDQSMFTTSWSNFYYSTASAYFTIRPINFINCKVDKILASTHYIFHNSFRTDERMTQHVVMANATNANHFYIYRNQFKNAKVIPQEGIGVHLIGDQLTSNYVECNTFLDLNNDIYINGGPGGDMAGGTVCHWPIINPRGCPILSPTQIISAGNVFSNCGVPNFNIVNNSGNAVNYFEPNFPNCINDISGTTTTFNVQPNLCELPCGTCTYDFDYDQDPPKCGGQEHRLGTESANSTSVHSEISVYPNPANNHFSINFGKIEMPCNISIYDMKGQLVKTFEATESITDINTDNYLPGVYVIKIQNSNIGINEIQKIQILK